MQSDKPRQQKPWYRHAWVWLLLAVPATAVIVGMFLLYFAITTNDGLVVDDYYERGKAINRDLARDQAALMHQLTARLDFDKAGNRVLLTLQSHDYVLPRQPRLSFLHPIIPAPFMSSSAASGMSSWRRMTGGCRAGCTSR